MLNNNILEIDESLFTEEELNKLKAKKFSIYLTEESIKNKNKAKENYFITGAIGYIDNQKTCFIFAHGGEDGSFQFSPLKSYYYEDLIKCLNGFYKYFLKHENVYLNNLYKSLLIANEEDLPIFIHGCYDSAKNVNEFKRIKPLTKFGSSYSYAEAEYKIINNTKYIKFSIEEIKEEI